MHPDVIEAADEFTPEGQAEDCARRVLAAQAKPEAISDGAVDAAIDARYPGKDWRNLLSKEIIDHCRDELRATLSAALEYMAKEGE
jgi:hypothetical protein